MALATMKSRVDIVMPAYNAAATLAEAIQSIQRQTLADFRLVVVDDGSSDRSRDIARGFAASDARIVLIERVHGGIVDALNAALEVCTAPYVARHDSDDMSHPDRLAIQIAHMDENPATVAASGSCIHIDSHGDATGTVFAPVDPDTADTRCLPSREPYLLHPFLVVRRRALRQVGGYRYVFNAEDTDLYWRLRERGRLSNLRQSLGKMRLHAGSVANVSILNGRIMAVSSQLAALSAQRRARGLSDIEFPKCALAGFHACRSLEGIIGYAGRQLDADERSYLRAASAVKLLELATGRAYELEREDCEFIRRVYETLQVAQFGGRCVANWAYRASLSRLLRQQMFDRAKSLVSMSLTPRIYLHRLLH